MFLWADGAYAANCVALLKPSVADRNRVQDTEGVFSKDNPLRNVDIISG